MIASSKTCFRLRSSLGVTICTAIDAGLISLFCMWASSFLSPMIEDASLGTMLVFGLCQNSVLLHWYKNTLILVPYHTVDFLVVKLLNF